MLQINLIGAGRVGQTLGYLLVQSGEVALQAVMALSRHSAERAVQFIGQGYYCATIAELPPAELTLITTPDAALEGVSRSLFENAPLRPNDIVLHCSGAYTSEQLAIVRERGCLVASLHPVCSIAMPAVAIQSFSGTLCALEGDAEAVRLVSQLVTQCGVVPFLVEKQQKALYHAGSVFAANYLVTLAEQACRCFQQAGLQEHLIKPLIQQLMHTSLVNVLQAEQPAHALTGPMQRGDVATLKAHLAVLPSGLRSCYLAMARATLPLLKKFPEHQLTAVFDE